MKPYLKYIYEVLAIVVGITISFMVDEWREMREERKLELEYVNRLKHDLENDLYRFTSYRDSVYINKRKVLEYLLVYDTMSYQEKKEVFTAENMDYSGYKALPNSRTVTYQELENTGLFRLIRSIEVRNSINEYYIGYRQTSAILAEPTGKYRELFSDIFPSEIYVKLAVDHVSIDSKDVLDGVSLLIDAPSIREAVNSELYYAADLLFWLNKSMDLCMESLAAIQENYPDL